MTPKLRMDLMKVVTITVSYMMINVFSAILIDAAINSNYSGGPSAHYGFVNYLALSLMVGFIAGVLGGSAMVALNNRILSRRSYGYSLVITAAVYTLVFIVVNVINTIVMVAITPSLSGLEGANKVIRDLTFNQLTLVIFFFWGVITMLTMFMLQVNDKFGPGLLWKFIQGKYFNPREEVRVFMFADMRSSTTIAEKIGHTQYFNLLSDLFADITRKILQYEGEIYQYVGDEIVVSWELKKGLRNNNCLHCFLEIEDLLLDLGPKYEEKYGVRPELKAGIHHGSVTAGEVGVIKKDIVFTGDVLNTTARIQEQCNQHGVNVLMSGDTMSLLNKNDLRVQEMGSFELRGKSKTVNLVTVS